MAITGTGTEQDPYVVTTYAELTAKAVESGAYIEIDNDIDVAKEYPNNNVPKLEITSIIDGKGHYIKNLYKKGSGELIYIHGNYAKVSNVHFTNIYKLSNSGSFNQSASILYSTTGGFYNCEFRGVVCSGVFLYCVGYSGNLFNQCNIKLLIKNNGCFCNINNSATQRSPKINGCRVNIKTQDANKILFKTNGSSSNTVNFGGDSYYIIDMPNFYEDSSCVLCNFDNCVFDITTQSNGTFEIPSSSVARSAFNRSHAPNITLGSKLIGVADEYWLNAEYLDSVGFNIVYEPPQ